MFESLKVKENYRVKILRINGGLYTESYNIRETFNGLKHYIQNLCKDKSNYEIEVFKNGKMVVNLINS